MARVPSPGSHHFPSSQPVPRLSTIKLDSFGSASPVRSNETFWGRLFSRKIDAPVTISMTASRQSEQCRFVGARPTPRTPKVYELEGREMREESDAELLK